MQQLNKYIITDLGTEEVSILSQQDEGLIGSFHLDSVPFYVDKYQVNLGFYDLNQNHVETVSDISSYTILGINKQSNVTEITVNPVDDGLENGYLGDIILKYEITNNVFSPSKDQDINSNLYIAEISSDRTEIRAKAAKISSGLLSKYVSEASGKLNGGTYFPEIYLNFFQTDYRATITNIVLETVGKNKYVTIKLYQPLPESIGVKEQFYIQERIGNVTAFKVIRDVELIPDTAPQLRRPNFDVETEEYSTNVTDYVGYGELLSYPLTTSYKQLYSIYADNGIELSIDHTDYRNFIHFSSAVERLENFRYKLSLITSYEEALKKASSSTEETKYNKLIQNIIANFDHYDRFLYFENDSKSWPKTDSNRPYTNVSPDSSEVQDWWDEHIAEAKEYDDNNPDILIGTIPTGLREDPTNEPYLIFVDMIGHHFDNEWVYAKAVGERYNADNRLDHGISKDLVRDAIASFGIDICKSNQNLTDLFAKCNVDGTYDVGKETSVNYFKRISAGKIVEIVREFDGKYAPVETVEETLNGLTSSDEAPYRVFDGKHSDSNTDTDNTWQPTLVDTYRKEIYKRIYHNLPILIKAKGTNRGLRTLINCFGIPDNILTINVQGGTKLGAGYFGPEAGTSASIDRIRINQTSSIIPFTYNGKTFEYVNTLDNSVPVSLKSKSRSQNSNLVDIGFDLTKQFDEYTQQQLGSSFDYNSIIGDSRNTEENYGEAFSLYFNRVLTEASSSKVNFRSPSSIIRLVRYIDSTLYRSIEDFISARDSVTVGVVAKDNILHRNRYSGLKQSGAESETYTGTVQMDYIEAGHGGSVEAPTDYSQSWSTSEATGHRRVFGGVSKYDGELSGSNCTVVDGELIKRNVWDNKIYDYNPFAHSGQNASTYRLNFKFLCLPAQIESGLDVRGTNTALRIKVYSNYGTVSYNYSYGVDTLYGGNSKLETTTAELYGGNATDDLEYTYNGGTATTINNKAKTSQQVIKQGEGSALMYTGVKQFELTCDTSSTDNLFLGWYAGNISDTDSHWDDFICSGPRLILESGSTLSDSYTARFGTGATCSDVLTGTLSTSSSYNLRISCSNANLTTMIEENGATVEAVKHQSGEPDKVVVLSIQKQQWPTLDKWALTVPEFITDSGVRSTLDIRLIKINNIEIPKMKYGYLDGTLYRLNWNI